MEANDYWLHVLGKSIYYLVILLENNILTFPISNYYETYWILTLLYLKARTLIFLWFVYWGVSNRKT